MTSVFLKKVFPIFKLDAIFHIAVVRNWSHCDIVENSVFGFNVGEFFFQRVAIFCMVEGSRLVERELCVFASDNSWYVVNGRWNWGINRKKGEQMKRFWFERIIMVALYDVSYIGHFQILVRFFKISMVQGVFDSYLGS